MPIHSGAITLLQKIYEPEEVREVIRLAKKQDLLELRWRRRFDREIKEWTDWVAEHLDKYSTLPDLKEVSFKAVVLEHSMAAMTEGIASVPKKDRELHHLAVGKAPPEPKLPGTLAGIRKLWDEFRTKGKMPARQRDIAERLKKEYLKKVQDAYRENSEAFRTGDAFEQSEAVKAIKRKALVTYARAETIVNTETTYYYNAERKQYFDSSPDVTHYLFAAIRDGRTTSWCKTRHGLVYKKDDPLFDDEMPPCHWNCRSTILPLVKQNKRHLALINDPSIQRRNNKCTPLPPGWNRRAS